MDTSEAGENTFGIEVILEEDGRTAPSCLHGPTLLFEKVDKSGERGRRFYSCSACRDRKDCSFFQWEDEKVSEARLLAREAEKQRKQAPFSHEECCTRLRRFASLPPGERTFCQDCQMLVLPEEHQAHSSHSSSPVADAQLRRPSLLLRPLDHKRSHAQYLFADRSSRFLLDVVAALGYSKVLCVGTPRLQELIRLRNLEQTQEPTKSLLLDIDFRYAQFYSPDQFCHYNMFNNHFFGGEASAATLRGFLTEASGQKVVMVADPPFGGLVKPLANSFSLLSRTWRELQGHDAKTADMPMIWIFPYFFEPRILKCLPSFSMLDYQVDYDNHPLYKHGKKGRKQSPVRLFTNIAPREVVLPEEEGYRFCSACDRYVSSLNKHCAQCHICPSKDGREWKHCSACGKCVKPSWRHCQACGRCSLPDHPCGRGEAEKGCFECGSVLHRRRSCPCRNASGRDSCKPAAKNKKPNVSRRPLRKAKADRKPGARRTAQSV